MLRIINAASEERLEELLFRDIKEKLERLRSREAAGSGFVHAGGNSESAGSENPKAKSAPELGNENANSSLKFGRESSESARELGGKDTSSAQESGDKGSKGALGSGGGLIEPLTMNSGELRAPRQVVLVVPAQYTLRAEERAFRSLGGDGFFDFHIMSGNRLIHQIVHETGGPGLTPVNNLGRTMMLRRIARNRAQDLKCYGSLAESSEFLKLAGDFIVQAKQNKIDEEAMPLLVQASPEGSLLRDKLSDMQILMSEYQLAMAGRFSDSEDLLAFAAGNAKDSPFVRDSYFFYFGFYSFTSNEMDFLTSLAEAGCGLTVMLQGAPSEGLEDDVFMVPRRSAQRLTALCREKGIPVERLTEAEQDRQAGAGLDAEQGCQAGAGLNAGQGRHAKTRAEAEQDRQAGAEGPAGDAGGGAKAAAAAAAGTSAADGCDSNAAGTREIKLVCCASPFAQAETIAAEASELIRTGKAKPGEIAVLCADPDADGSIMSRVFADFELPIFMDSKRSVSHNPAAAFISAALDIAAGGFEKEALLTMLKSPYLPEALRNTRLPSYMELYHIEGRNFEKPLKYGSAKYPEEEFTAMEEARSGLCALLSPFCKAFETAETAADKSKVLYNFMEESLGIRQMLQESAAQLSEEGYLDASEEISQLWGAVCSLLDQIVELLGSEKLSPAEYRDIFQSSLQDIEIGVLPQSEGMVQLGSISRSRIPGIKALFIAGFNDGRIPPDGGGDFLLSDREQEELMAAGFTVCKGSELLDAENRLLVHNALSQPVSYLWLGWCAADEKGEAMKPSPMLLEFAEKHALKEEKDIENSGSSLPFIQGSSPALSRLGEEMRRILDSDGSLNGMDPALMAVYGLLEPEKRASIRDALLYKGGKPRLEPGLTKELYTPGGRELSLSPSRLESFAACPFKHFVRYGLSPEESREFAIDSLTVGNIHHEALLALCQRLSKPSEEAGKPISSPDSLWSTITDEELRAMMDQILEELAESGFDGIMKAGDRESYQSRRIRKVCKDFARQLVLQVRKGNIDSMYFETGFGRGRNFPAIDLPTSLGTVHVEGRIDRVDLIKTSDGSYVKVVDYKSGYKKFERDKVEKGLALQLMCYLEGTLGRKDLKPAGVFYFMIREPRQEASFAELAADELSVKLRENLEKEYMLNGMFVERDDVLRSLDRELPEADSSTVISFKRTKEGKIKAGGMVSEEEFEAFRSRFRKTLEGICSELAEGSINPRPRRVDKLRTSCDLCDYRSICLYGTER